jgi:cytoskeletal protein RodZ
VSIGDVLAEGRRHAGLTITQVSQRTCIRETIIRAIERGDFSGCGGDFYARGHIRSIAEATGVDPEPLIREYDATMSAPRAISAADVFQPVTPVRLKERRRPNWTAAMAVALAAVIGAFFVFHHFSRAPAATAANQAAKVHQTRHASTPPPASASPASAHNAPRGLHIRLTATQNSWVQLRTVSGATIFSGVVYSGTSMNWTERHDVLITIGNPAAVKLIVNGKSKIPRGRIRALTIRLHARRA